jgi:tryptophan halogenase
VDDMVDTPGAAEAANQDPGDRRIRRIAIVGGGTAGWVAASMLARALPGYGCAITVIESPDIGTIGVGEATIPPIIDLLRFLGINEADFIRHTQSTYKLGIKLVDWRQVGESYWHPFGTFGAPINRRPFFHSWHRARAEGLDPQFNDYSLCAALGDAGRFRLPDAAAQGPVSGLRYALHFDAGLVAQYLRAYAERLGVARLERTVASAEQRADGALDALVFTDGSRLEADLFIDCSGFRGVLIEQVLKTGYVDWSGFLPCDRAVAMPTALAGPRAPYTQARARTAGWQWRIPLQHRVGNGYVYASAQIEDTAALDDLLATLGETPLVEPRFLRFNTGRRKLFWNRNCLALGLASGFMEPLESTSIHLVISGVYNLLDRFPDRGFDQHNIDAYNAEVTEEVERIRDFIVLHYCTTQREDSALWRHCQSMALPDSLLQRIEVYKATGRVRPNPGELFTDASWFYIFEGMGVVPAAYDPLADIAADGAFREIMTGLARATAAAAQDAPSHDSYFPPRAIAS